MSQKTVFCLKNAIKQLLIAVLGMLCANVTMHAQVYKRLDDKFGFKDLKFGMSMNQALSNISYSDFQSIRPNEVIRFTQSDLNAIGVFKVKFATLSFQNNKLSEIELYVDGNDNIQGILQALKMAYGTPVPVKYIPPDSIKTKNQKPAITVKAPPGKNPDSLKKAFRDPDSLRAKVFVWTQDAAASDMFNPANQSKSAAQAVMDQTPRMNALWCDVESLEWNGDKVLLHYNIFRAVHYPIVFAVMTVRDKSNLIDLRKRDAVFIRFQKAAEDL
jgi:Cu/Ag efflux protein CusF